MISKKKIILMLSIGVLYFVFDTLLQAGVFKKISNSNQIPGQIVKGVLGPEDMEWDRGNNIIYVSSTDRRSTYKGVWQASDGIYMLSPKSGDTHKMKTNYTGEFHPHGISLFEQLDKKYLYTVNHFKNQHSIELFEIHSDSLFHVKSYTHDLLNSPNDVAGVAIDEFYVSNDHGNTSRLGIKIENYLRMPYSYVVHYKDQKYSKALEGLVYANGLQVANDDSILIVTHTIGREVIFLDRDRVTGELKEFQRLNMMTGADNISVDEEGSIWIAAHPQLLKFSNHANNPMSPSPSQVFKLKRSEDGYEMEKVFENDGEMISASSVAVHVNGNLFVGGVFDDKIIKITP